VRATERCIPVEGYCGRVDGDSGGGAVTLPGWFEVGCWVVGLAWLLAGLVWFGGAVHSV
jgi:hypothetical protein